MKKIVVFGASGDVGRYFIDYLLAKEKKYDYFSNNLSFSLVLLTIGWIFVTAL